MTFDEIYAAFREQMEARDLSGFGDGVYAYEFDITGEGEGKFYISVTDGRTEMQPFDYRNALCTFTVDGACLLAILRGQQPPVAAYASGRLRLRGDSGAAIRLADVLGLPL